MQNTLYSKYIFKKKKLYITLQNKTIIIGVLILE